MNFQTILEELDRLYEEDKAKAEENVTEEVAEEAVVTEQLTEAADDAEAVEADEEEIEIVDDEPAAEEEVVEAEAQFVLECAKCGGLMIKAEADVNADEESGLANMDDACQYCEATDGYKVIGTMVPFEVVEAEEVEETEEAEAVEEVIEADDEVVAEA